MLNINARDLLPRSGPLIPRKPKRIEYVLSTRAPIIMESFIQLHNMLRLALHNLPQQIRLPFQILVIRLPALLYHNMLRLFRFFLLLFFPKGRRPRMSLALGLCEAPMSFRRARSSVLSAWAIFWADSSISISSFISINGFGTAIAVLLKNREEITRRVGDEEKKGESAQASSLVQRNVGWLYVVPFLSHCIDKLRLTY